MNNPNPIDFMSARQTLYNQRLSELSAVELDMKRKAEVAVNQAPEQIYDSENAHITAKAAYMARKIDVDYEVQKRNRNATLVDYEYAEQHDETLVDLYIQMERYEALLNYHRNKFLAAQYLIAGTN